VSRSDLGQGAIPPALGFSVPLEPSHLSRARERLRAYLQMHCADAELVADVVLCLEEACTNVIRHSGASEAMQVALRFTDDALVCKVRDYGRGFDIDEFDPEAVPDPLAGDGRGLFIISQIMDELSLRFDGGLEVHMVKRAVPRCVAQGPNTGSDEGCDQSPSGARQT
jgi:serine/threonine-protein kinase RsbW